MLPAGADAGWETPRMPGYVQPRWNISDVFAVYLCSRESREAGRHRAGGVPEVLRGLAGEVVVVRKRGCVAGRRGFINPGEAEDELVEIATKVISVQRLLMTNAVTCIRDHSHQIMCLGHAALWAR